MTSLCQICAEVPPKYRCPSCDARTCSLRCTQKHKTKCHTSPSITDDTSNHESQTEVIEDSKPNNSSQVSWEQIARSPEIQKLLAEHPSLQQQLSRIYQITKARQVGREQPHRNRGEGFGTLGGNHHSRNVDAQDRKFSAGVNELTRQLEAGSEQSAHLTKFCETVDALLKRQTPPRSI